MTAHKETTGEMHPHGNVHYPMPNFDLLPLHEVGDQLLQRDATPVIVSSYSA
jgi:hypothetical protein